MRESACQRPGPRGRPHAGMLGGMGLVALVGASLLGGCGTARSVPTVHGTPTPPATATPAPTPTVAPARPLEWVRRTGPPGVWLATGGGSGTRGMLAAAPGDGATAYVCFVPGNVYDDSATVQVWATHDAAATWQALPALTPPTPVQNCRVLVDAAAAGTLVVELAHSYGMGGGPTGEMYHYFSHDGGATWQAYDSKYTLVTHLVTVNGRVYATLRRPRYSRSSSYGSLVVSTDGLRTRTKVYPYGPPATVRDGQDLELAVWGNPVTGELLVVQRDYSNDGQTRVATSADGGATWRPMFTLPQSALNSVFVQQPYANQPWALCTSGRSVPTGGQGEQAIRCTGDGGATWQERGHQLSGGVYLLQDGSVFSVTGYGFQRVTPTGTQWESLGGWPVGYGTQQHDAGPMLAGRVLWLPDDRGASSLPPPPVPAAIYMARVP